mmetsp:Transcript_4281/g.8192  ORF Transcript_4281/g.8192 Transcript_4281/m.8192 type:complete len:230 (+) Transcript_4281:162-851(+)
MHKLNRSFIIISFVILSVLLQIFQSLGQIKVSQLVTRISLSSSTNKGSEASPRPSSSAFNKSSSSRLIACSANIQKIYVFPTSDSEQIQSEHKHFILDGVQNSERLELTNDPLDNEAIWIVNAGRYSCDLFQKDLKHRLDNASSLRIAPVDNPGMMKDASHLIQSSSIIPSADSIKSDTRNRTWSIIFMDWTDQGVLTEYKPCLENIYNSFGYDNQKTFVATRTVLRGR